MKIKELRLKNFGKFTNKEIHFLDGMNVSKTAAAWGRA